MPFYFGHTKNFGEGVILRLMVLLIAKQYIDELNRMINVITEKDYEDPGNKIEF